MSEKTIVAGIPLDQQPTQEEIEVPYNPHEGVDDMIALIDTIIVQAPVRNQSAEKLQLIEDELKSIWTKFESDKDKAALTDAIQHCRDITLTNISDADIDSSSRLVIEDIMIKILQESHRV